MSHDPIAHDEITSALQNCFFFSSPEKNYALTSSTLREQLLSISEHNAKKILSSVLSPGYLKEGND